MSLKKYFRTLSIEKLLEEVNNSKDLARTLGWFQLILLGIGAIIGAGIFVYTGQAAAQNAGPALVLSFALAGLACMCAAFCYAEMASTLPVSGSAYTYTYATLGEFPAWLIAGMATLSCCFGSAAVASGWSGYVLSLLADFGIHFPLTLASYFGSTLTSPDGEMAMGLLNIPAILIVCFLGYIVMLGAETSASVNAIIVYIKFTVLFAFIVIGGMHVDPVNWVPFIPENTGEYGHFGISGIFAAAAAMMLSYSGFDAVATAAQETKKPKRDLPIGIIGSLVVSMVIYMLVSLVMTGLTSYKNLNVTEPVAVAVSVLQMPWFSFVIKIGAIAGLTTVILVLIYAAVRIFYTITHDGLLPKFLAKTHKKHKTPHLLTVLITGFVAFLTNLTTAAKLAAVASFGTMVTFTVVCIVTLYLRKKRPDLKREFRCPWVPVVPVIGIILFGSMIYSLDIEVLIYAACWIAFMTVVYMLYGSRHSALIKKKAH